MELSNIFKIGNYILYEEEAVMKKNSGMTMVEVIMGFVILMLLMGMLSGIIAAATNIYRNSVDLKRAEESLQEKLYMKDISDTAEVTAVELSLIPDTDMPGDNSPVLLSAKLCALSSVDILSQEDAENLNVKICFLK